MKRILLFTFLAAFVIGPAFCQNNPAFTPVFRNLGLSAGDVSVMENQIKVSDMYSFTIKQVPGYNLFVWLESSNTSSNVLLKPYHNFQVKNNEAWEAYMFFPRPGVWHVAVFFIPEGTSQLLNLFGFTVTASAAAEDAAVKRTFTEITGKVPE